MSRSKGGHFKKVLLLGWFAFESNAFLFDLSLFDDNHL